MFSEQALAPLNAAVAKLGFLVKGDVTNLADAALRFVLSHPAVSSVIPGIRSARQVDDNAAASGRRLPDADVARLHDLYREEFRALPFH